jgi:ribonuclease P protein component
MSSRALRVGVAENGLDKARVGFAVPRATGGAVQRNRLRRRLRELLRPRLAELAGVDVVISVRRDARKLSGPELAAELERCTAGALNRRRGTSGGAQVQP